MQGRERVADSEIIYGTDEWRRRVSEGKQRSDLIRFSMEHVSVPDKWKCPRCKKWKKIPEEMGTRTYITKSGVKRVHVRDKCKKCDSEVQAEYKARKIAEDPDGFTKRRRETANRSNRKRRAPSPPLPAEPLADWLREWIPRNAHILDRLDDGRVVRRYSPSTISAAGGITETYLRRILNGEYPSERYLPIETVDKMLHFCDSEHMMSILYGSG